MHALLHTTYAFSAELWCGQSNKKPTRQWNVWSTFCFLFTTSKQWLESIFFIFFFNECSCQRLSTNSRQGKLQGKSLSNIHKSVIRLSALHIAIQRVRSRGEATAQFTHWMTDSLSGDMGGVLLPNCRTKTRTDFGAKNQSHSNSTGKLSFLLFEST